MNNTLSARSNKPLYTGDSDGYTILSLRGEVLHSVQRRRVGTDEYPIQCPLGYSIRDRPLIKGVNVLTSLWHKCANQLDGRKKDILYCRG